MGTGPATHRIIISALSSKSCSRASLLPAAAIHAHTKHFCCSLHPHPHPHPHLLHLLLHTVHKNSEGESFAHRTLFEISQIIPTAVVVPCPSQDQHHHIGVLSRHLQDLGDLFVLLQSTNHRHTVVCNPLSTGRVISHR